MVFYLTLFFGLLAIICSLCVITVKNPVHSILYLILVFCNVSFILIIWNVEFVAIIFLIVYVGAIAVLFLFVVMMLNIKIIELNEVFWRYLPIGLLISSIFILEIFFLLFNQKLSFFSFFVLLFNFLSQKYFFFFFSFDVSLPSQIPSFVVNSSIEFKRSFLLSYGYPMGCLFQDNFVFQYSFLGLFYFDNFFIINDFYYWFLNNEAKSNTEVLGWFIYTYGFFLFYVISLILLLAMVGSIVLILNQNINVKRQLIYKQVARNFSNSIRLVN